MRTPFLMALAMVACGSPSEPGEPVRSNLDRDLDPEVTNEQLASLTESNRRFAFDLYHGVSDQADNLFLSPHSISIALAMTYAGAEGTTEQQMAEALQFDLPEPTLHQAFNRLDLDLQARGEARVQEGEPPILRVVNTTWGQTGYAFEPDYLDVLALNYGAGMNLLDFAADPEASRTQINDWVEDMTSDRIEDLIPAGAIKSSTRLVLTNAIYFKGSWVTPFQASQTAPAPFTTLGGGTVQADTMNGTLRVPYADLDGFAIVELPFSGEEVALQLLVPDADRFAEIEASFDQATYDAAVQAMTVHDVSLAVPKFEMKSPLDLVEPLQSLGMVDAFGAANFDGISEGGGLAITDVIHQGFLAVNEEGAEAAAATAVIMGESAAPLASLTVDRPFLVTIVDRPTGALLFLGRVADPTE
ncbi:MAG: serpin family protein [Myxococcales bacterium]|nr:serpin family protein [Myxococcales bacterium]